MTGAGARRLQLLPVPRQASVECAPGRAGPRHELEQSIGELKSREHMRCFACGVGINIDTNRLVSAAEETQKAIEKVPPEITIKVFR